ncbi:polyprenyl synthetase family protein [Streptomyces sp. NPDC048330]|uniref:polyprenyl synthetase family protein n=1 Tax=Streptomyces sp. NPDC048330 TaxID=3365533 RepID=UPI00371F8676
MTGNMVGGLLQEAARRTDRVVEDLLVRVGGEAARVVGYQWGMWDHDGRPVPRGAPGRGKSIRAALAIASARATGRPDGEPLVTAAACAVELLHVLSLLHDDVMDGDAMRRGRPAAWRVFGAGAVESAVRTLTPRALDLVFDTAPSGGVRPRSAEALRAPARVAGLLGHAVVRLSQGQALDLVLVLEREPRPEVSATLRVHADKTGSLFSCACAVGAAPAQADRLALFGEHLGVAFQIVDDLLGIWGDPAVTGKPAGSDLAARKKSHPVVVALAGGREGADDAVSAALHTLFARPGPWTPQRTRAARRLMNRSGARDRSRAAADEHGRAALSALDGLGPLSGTEARGRGELRALAGFVTARAR